IRFEGSGRQVNRLHGVRVEMGEPGVDGRRPLRDMPGSEFSLDADLVLLALGFVHPQQEGLLNDLGVSYDSRGNVATDENYQTSVSGVFAAGDMRRGQSLIVWAIAEGRSAARGVDRFLSRRSAPLLTGAGTR